MDSKQICIERIKFLDNINFVEQIEGKYTIGYIEHYCTNRIKVLYLEDNLGSYVSLLYVMEMKNNCDSVCEIFQEKLSTGDLIFQAQTLFLHQASQFLIQIWLFLINNFLTHCWKYGI